MLTNTAPAGEINLQVKENRVLLIHSPVTFLNFGVQNIDPSFSTLFSTPPLDHFGTLSPLGGSILLNPLLEDFIFRDTPVPLLGRPLRVFEFLHTLTSGFVRDLLRDYLPLLSIGTNQLNQSVVV